MVDQTPIPLWLAMIFVHILRPCPVLQLGRFSHMGFHLNTYLAIQRIGHELSRLHAHKEIYAIA